MNLQLKNKIALVTAASAGLGKAAAMVLAQEGAIVAICSRREKEINESAKDICTKTGAKVFPFVADVSKAEDIQKLISETENKIGEINILVSNAGGPPTGNILTMTDEDWQKGYDLTLMSTVRLVRGVLPNMIKQKWGRIITITSITAKQPINELLLSSVIRPGILGLAKVLANQYAKDNITINNVCPGHILTKRQEELAISRSAAKNISIEQYFEEVSSQIPAGRLGKPEELANVIAFLASEQASYINGANILVDGSMSKGIH